MPEKKPQELLDDEKKLNETEDRRKSKEDTLASRLLDAKKETRGAMELALAGSKPQAAPKQVIRATKAFMDALDKLGLPNNVRDKILREAEEDSISSILLQQMADFPLPLMSTRQLNAEVWADGKVTDEEYGKLIKNQSKIVYNKMLIETLMDRLLREGIPSQQLNEVRSRFDKLRRALEINTTSLNRAKYRSKEKDENGNPKLKAKDQRINRKDNKIIVINLSSNEIVLVQPMLREMQVEPKDRAKDLGLVFTRPIAEKERVA